MPDLGLDRLAARLLLVDADDARRASLAGLLSEDGYGAVLECTDIWRARQRVDAQTPDLVLLDIDAPGVSSDTVADLVFASGDAGRLPVIGLTSDATAEGRDRASRIGVSDFALWPIGHDELRLRVERALDGVNSSRLHRESPAPRSADEDDVSDRQAVRESLSVLAAIGDYHDEVGGLHAQRVGIVSAAIASALKLPDSFALMLRDAAPLHDIGKVAISRRILLKPEKLTPSEWLHMMSHVDLGARILGSARAQIFLLAAEIAQTHHEHWDGTGYTAGLIGEEIPMSGRIVAVADVWDSLTHDRPYRKAWSFDQAMAEMLSLAGTQFDPAVVAAFSTLDIATLTASEPAQPAAA